MNKIFTVLINKHSYDVYNLNKEHEGLNDTPTSWWIYLDSDELLDGQRKAPTNEDDEYFIPYDSNIKRICWKYEIEESVSTKYKWDSINFRNHIKVKLYANNRLVYEDSFNGNYMQYVLAKIETLKVEMSEHPFDFFEPEKENGRLIYYYGLPAKIKVTGINHIGIIPDYCILDKDRWWVEYARRKSLISKLTTEMEKDDYESDKDDMFEDMEAGYINWGSPLSDGNIKWFRNE